MVVGVGIDVASIERIRAVLERHGDRFWRRVLTEREQALLGARRDRAVALAGRWAAKEAAIKALRGRTGYAYQLFEILRAKGDEPRIEFRGRAADVAAELGVVRAHVSITHDAGVAAAVVVLEGQP